MCILPATLQSHSLIVSYVRRQAIQGFGPAQGQSSAWMKIPIEHIAELCRAGRQEVAIHSCLFQALRRDETQSCTEPYPHAAPAIATASTYRALPLPAARVSALGHSRNCDPPVQGCGARRAARRKLDLLQKLGRLAASRLGSLAHAFRVSASSRWKSRWLGLSSSGLRHFNPKICIRRCSKAGRLTHRHGGCAGVGGSQTPRLRLSAAASGAGCDLLRSCWASP